MTTGANDVWLFRIVHQDTGKPAPGVPVTVLDRAGNAEGHWVSDANGTVAIPRRETLKLRIRVGLRSEDPIELATATLGEGPTPLAAPTQLPPTIGSIGHVGERPGRDAPPAQPPPPRGAEQPEAPGHVLYFQRLVMFGERAAATRPATGAGAGPRDGAVDFFSPATDSPSAMRYGVLIELEEYWQSLGVLWGELLYSVTLTPGDEAKLAVLDGRWRREADGREPPRAQHDARPARHLSFLRAARALQGDGAESARPPGRVRAVPIAERRDRRRDSALRLPVPAHAARSRPAPRLGAFALRRGGGRGSLGCAAQPPARAHRSEPAVLLDRDHLGRGSGGALRRALEVARSRGPAPHRRGGEHGDRTGRQRHRAAPALGGRAAGPVAGRARRLSGAPAAGERRLRGRDSASRRVGERPGPRADAAGAGRLARGGRVSHLRRSFLYSSVVAALAACLFQSAPVTPQVAKDSAAAGPAAPRS